jgi:3-deoxy-D-manno-octulosonic acid (KDO) 8-phosphate synthase
MAVPTPFGPGPFLIAGPCVVEDDRLNLQVGERLAQLAQRLRIPVI